jgi:hypothetical protein|tara:strand:- start:821 stop:1207 length:387 start_codon:yes stop_codon:yes gene_type:complete
MKDKIIYLLFFLCLAKIYYIADRNLNFSYVLLLESFKKNSGEKTSLGPVANDIISSKKFFLKKNINEFQLSDEIVEKKAEIYQRMIEFNYPIKNKKNTPILVARKSEGSQANCKLLISTQNLNIYECE